MHKKKVIDLQNYRDDEADTPESAAVAEVYLRPGTTLLFGQYTIVGYLNCGGFGITYLAQDSFGRKVAVKECFPSELCLRAGNEMRPNSMAAREEIDQIVDHFIREAQRLAGLEHPAIVHVHQIFEENGTAYLVMDFLEGPDLLDIAEGHAPLPAPSQIEAMTETLLRAVAFVHGRGFLHRDLSPDNILLQANCTPVLIDFGAAREIDAPKRRRPSRLKCVKDGYSPAEFYAPDSPQGPWSDLYGLAASLHHLIVGFAPEDAPTRLAAVAAGEGDPYRPLAPRVEMFSPPFLRAIDTALALQPEDRLQSAEDWLAALGMEPDEPTARSAREVSLSARSVLLSGPVGMVTAPFKAGPRRAPKLLAATALALAGLGAVVFVAGDALPSAPVPSRPDAALAVPQDLGRPAEDAAGAVTLAALAAPPVWPQRPAAMMPPLAPDLAPAVAAGPVTDLVAPLADLAIVAPAMLSGVSGPSAHPPLPVAEQDPPVAALLPPEAAPVFAPIRTRSLRVAPAGVRMAALTLNGETRIDAMASPGFLPEASQDAAFSGDLTPPAFVDETAPLRPDQVAYAHWDVVMPFDSRSEKQRNADVAVITAVTADADLAISGDWIAEGVVIYAYNGVRLAPGLPLSALVLEALTADPDGYSRGAVRYRDAETGAITRGLLAVPITRRIGLADGSVIAARIEGRDWVFTVAEAGPGSELRPGDVITGIEGARLEAPEDLALRLEALAGAGQGEARLGLLREGRATELAWRLARVTPR
ncbi:MAG: protein kinase [Silicimonas sp.]|nr:protein kinase [Silicimonas sp.]